MSIEPTSDLEALMRSRPGQEVTTAYAVFLSYLAQRPAWMADAACRGMGSGAFFVQRGGDVVRPKAVCASCSVIGACREYAASFDVEGGIWAGVTAAKIRSSGRTAA